MMESVPVRYACALGWWGTLDPATGVPSYYKEDGVESMGETNREGAEFERWGMDRKMEWRATAILFLLLRNARIPIVHAVGSQLHKLGALCHIGLTSCSLSARGSLDR